MSKYDLKDGVSKKKLRQSRAKLLSSTDPTIEEKLAMTRFANSAESREQAHEGVRNAAQSAQEAHDLMLQLKKEVDRLRGLAEDAHRRMRQSKKVTDKLHNEFIFLLTRLGRELKKDKNICKSIVIRILLKVGLKVLRMKSLNFMRKNLNHVIVQI